MKELKNITPLEENFSRWFIDVVTKGNLIEYGPTKGTIIFKPLSYGMWENIQINLNKIIAKAGGQNVYLPLLIPQSYIEREKTHIKGFEPELATVTKIGDRQLEENYVIRPTSEVLFGELFSKEVHSYNDLPIIYNQWANVVRWEKKTNPFLRTSEFLWQEGHTAHSNALEARKFTKKMMRNYVKFCQHFLAIPTIAGKKTPMEKFAGAVTTYSIEAMMKDGRALQAGTSHYLGQNFSEAFDIKFKNAKNHDEFAYQSSWGVSTRLIGAIIMTHGDNRGIIMPPKIASYQIDILEINSSKDVRVSLVAQSIFKVLNHKYRVRIDKTDKSKGFKASQSEIQGVPLRIEVGPAEINDNELLIVRRDTLEQIKIKRYEIKKTVAKLLKEIQENLLQKATLRLNDNLVQVYTYEEMKQAIEAKKFVLVPFAGKEKEESKIKLDTGATARCIPFNHKLRHPRPCISTKEMTKRLVLFARSY